MSQFLSLLITGAVTGGIYAILASGLVITYVTSGIFDFAYGAVAFSVAYFYYQIHIGLGLPTWLSAILAIFVFGPALGLLLHHLIYRHLVKAPLMARIVAPIGVLVALPNLIFLISDWLTNTAHVPLANRTTIFLPPGLGPYPAKTWSFMSGATLNSDQLAVFIAAVVVATGLWYVIKKTPLGLRMRAVVDRRDLASLRGVDPARVSTQAVLMSSLLAALSGVLIGPLFNLSPDTFTYLMFVSAAGAALGRFRSIPIAMLGGLALGIAQDLVAGYINVSSSLVPGLRSAVPFIILMVTLYFLGRERGRVAGSIAEDPPPPDYLADLPRWRRALPWAIVTVALVLWIQLTSNFLAGLTAQGLALGIVFLSFVVITGTGGLVSLSQAAFVSIGAMVAALCVQHGMSFFLGTFVGAAAAIGLGILVALPSLRLGGLALALTTLAAGFMADQVLFNVAPLTGGSSGRPLVPPRLGPFNFLDAPTYAMTLLVIFGLVALCVRNLIRSKTGRLMMAVRSSPPAALTAGGSSLGPRLALFGVSAAIAGFGGALLAANNLRITGTDFPTQTGLFWIAVMVVFGVRRIGGALLAGLLSYLFPQLLSHLTSTTLLPPILFGMGAMTLAQQPDGFMAVVGLSRQATRARRALHAQLTADEEAPEPSVDVAEGEVAELSVPAAAAGPAANGDRRKAALALKGVSAGYEGMMVLHDLDLEVAEGSFVAIIGPNGAGKSTLCSVVSGLHAPARGQVWMHGRDVTSLPAHRRARGDLFLAPEYRGIFPGLTVEENLAVWLRDPSLRRAAMERFPVLGERRRFQADLLSGGEQQMLTLATALERPPRLLVLDEPSLGLSPIAAGQVFDTLAELHAGGTTVVVVEEQAKRAAELADTVMLLDLGRVRWHGPASEFTAQAAQELYLGSSKGS